MIAILAVTEEGKKLGVRIKRALLTKRRKVDLFFKKPLSKFVGEIFHKYDALVFICALGITVRVIAPYIKDKKTDPAVVVIDDSGKHAISVLSGHKGANKLTMLISGKIGATPVITTSGRKNLIIGIGAKKGIEKGKILSSIRQAFDESKLSIKNIKALATVDFKAEEEGIKKAADALGVPLIAIPKDKIKEIEKNFEGSKCVKEKTGIAAVCEPCALLAGKKTKLIQKKMKFNGVTIAIAEEQK